MSPFSPALFYRRAWIGLQGLKIDDVKPFTVSFRASEGNPDIGFAISAQFTATVLVWAAYRDIIRSIFAYCVRLLRTVGPQGVEIRKIEVITNGANCGYADFCDLICQNFSLSAKRAFQPMTKSEIHQTAPYLIEKIQRRHA